VRNAERRNAERGAEGKAQVASPSRNPRFHDAIRVTPLLQFQYKGHLPAIGEARGVSLVYRSSGNPGGRGWPANRRRINDCRTVRTAASIKDFTIGKMSALPLCNHRSEFFGQAEAAIGHAQQAGGRRAVRRGPQSP